MTNDTLHYKGFQDGELPEEYSPFAPLPNYLFEKYFPDGFTIRDEANALVACAFRNGPIERLHTSEYSELLEDNKSRRITGHEMKEIMLFACEKMEWLLRLRQSDPEKYIRFVVRYAANHCGKWDR